MKQETQVSEATRLLELKDQATTDLAESLMHQPVADYTDAAMAERERARLFRKLPLLIGLSCELPEPGTYLCDDFSGVPIIVLRRKDGTVAAYRNVCRHRGARLLSGRGTVPDRISCPYHAWTYSGESGDLIAIPFRQGFPGLDTRCMGLVSLPVQEVHGLIFVAPDPSACLHPGEFLGELRADLAGFILGDYHHFETRVLEQPLNWKLVVDTFLETYHLSTLHRTTIAPILHSNLNTFTPFGRHLRMIAARKSIDALRNEPQSSWDLVRHSAMVYVIFPNTVFIMQGDHLETWRVYPGDRPDAARMHVSLYTPERAETDSAIRHWRNNMDLLMATVLEEDFPLAADMQRDFRARTDTLVFGRNEPALQHFHRALHEELSNQA
ncbi:MAG TPA: SRPBCC family protein [Xanthomonadales bacterium]|nr:SRPBCC family protein [Xanthomonadales bacterium]